MGFPFTFFWHRNEVDFQSPEKMQVKEKHRSWWIENLEAIQYSNQFVRQAMEGLQKRP